MDLKSFNVLNEKTVKEFRKRLDDKANNSETTISIWEALGLMDPLIDSTCTELAVEIESLFYHFTVWRNSLFVSENVFYSLAAFEFYTNYNKKV